MLERGQPLRPHRLSPVDGHRPSLRRLPADPGPGCAGGHRQRRRRRLEPVPGRVAAGPARDLRAPRPAARGRPGPRGCGRGAISRRTLDPYYARAERGLRVQRPSWDQVSKSGGLWAATLAAAGYTCDRVPLAISRGALRERQVVPHRLHLRGQELADHQLPVGGRERRAFRSGPIVQVEQIAQTSARPYRYVVQADVMDNERPQPDPRPRPGARSAPVQGAGAGRRARWARRRCCCARGRSCPRCRPRSGTTWASTATTSPRWSTTPPACARVLGLPGYHEFYKGKPITTMSYDWWVGRARPRLRRHPIHAPGDLPLDA